MVFLDSEVSRHNRELENEKYLLRKQMLLAEEAEDIYKMRELQKWYHIQTGTYFETELPWQ